MNDALIMEILDGLHNGPNQIGSIAGRDASDIYQYERKRWTYAS